MQSIDRTHHFARDRERRATVQGEIKRNQRIRTLSFLKIELHIRPIYNPKSHSPRLRTAQTSAERWLGVREETGWSSTRRTVVIVENAGRDGWGNPFLPVHSSLPKATVPSVVPYSRHWRWRSTCGCVCGKKHCAVSSKYESLRIVVSFWFTGYANRSLNLFNLSDFLDNPLLEIPRTVLLLYLKLVKVSILLAEGTHRERKVKWRTGRNRPSQPSFPRNLPSTLIYERFRYVWDYSRCDTF